MMTGESVMAADAHDTNAEIWKSPAMIRDWLAQMDVRERKRSEQFLFIAQLLPFAQQDRFTFLDLGAGTGAAARAILKVYPNASAILADYSPHMIEAGARAMAPFHGRYRYVEFDMLTSDWPPTLPAELDAVVTSQCVHHLPDARKRSLFREILERLVAGGWYVNFDPVRASDPAVEAVWRRVAERLDPEAPSLRQPHTPEAHARHENHLRYMIDLDRQLGFLREAGFAAVDVYWKRLDYVIYGGRRDVAPDPGSGASDRQG